MLGVPQIVAAALEATKDMDARRAVRRPGRHRRAGDEHDAAAREPAASTSRSTRCTPPARSAARTASSTATATTSRPACSRRTRRTPCCSSRPGGSASPPAARRSVTASCSACCAAFGLVQEPVRHRAALSRAAGRLPRQGRLARSRSPLPDHGRPSPVVRRGAGRSRCRVAAALVAPRRRGRATRWRSSRPTTRSRSPASSGSAAPAPSGARSTRATRRPRTASCSTSSTARCWSTRPRSPPLVDQIRGDLPQLHDGGLPRRPPLDARGDAVLGESGPVATRIDGGPRTADEPAVDDVAMIVGTGGTTGRPKGVMLTGTNLETMTAHHPDELPVPGPSGLPRAGTADPRRRGALLPGAGPRRGGRDHADARRRPRSSSSSGGTASRTRSCRRR